MWGALRRLGVSPRDAADVAQETFLRVHRELHKFERERPLRPWLFAFAFHSARDYRRLARHRIEVMAELEDDADGGPLPDANLAQREQQALVEAALLRIPVERRAVLVAYELEELPMQEITAALSIPLHTGYSRLRQARVEFRDAVLSLAEQPAVRPSSATTKGAL